MKNNSNRLVILDLARFIAMLMMIQGHTIYALLDHEILNTSIFPWNVWSFLRGVTAPVFLMISGAVHVFANKRTETGIIPNETFFKRIRMSLILIAIGYFMMFPAGSIYDLPYIEYKYWSMFYRVNILHLFGVSLLMLTFLYKMTKNDKVLGRLSLSLGVLITFSSPLINNTNWFEIIPRFFASYLSYEGGSLFSIFPFSAYLFFGVYLGTLIKSIKKEKRENMIVKLSLPIGLSLAAIGLLITYGLSSINNDWQIAFRSNPGITFLRSGMVITGLFFIGIFLRKTRILSKYYSLFGKRAIFIYIIHLIIIYGCDLFPSFNHYYANSLSLGATFLITLLVLGLTLAIVYFIDNMLKYKPSVKTLFKYSLTAYMIYILFI